MAAPSEGDAHSRDVIELTKELRDPYVVFYGEDVLPPVPNAEPLGSLDEFAAKYLPGKKSGKAEEAPPPPVVEKPVPRVATVVARMTTTHSVGPLSVLFRAVRDRHRVKVWTRSHTRVRSILTGFVHAFDRHVNLALADVDEVLLLPPPPPPAPLQGPERSSASQAATLPLALRLPAWANDETVEQMDADGCTSAVSSTTVCETDRCSAPPAGGSERQSSPRHSVADIPLERTEASAATPGAPPSDPRPTTCSRRPARSGRRRRGLPLAPRSRHVNQLFVRGDNVVSVALLPV